MVVESGRCRNPGTVDAECISRSSLKTHKKCGDDMVCEDAECVQMPEVELQPGDCADTNSDKADGGLFFPGECTDSEGTYIDECTSEKTLMEYVCRNGVCEGIVGGCQKGYHCLDGACVKNDGYDDPCVDHDGDMHPDAKLFTKSECTHMGETLSDECTGDILKEAICHDFFDQGNPTCSTITVDCKAKYGELYYCEDGACKTDQGIGGNLV